MEMESLKYITFKKNIIVLKLKMNFHGLNIVELPRHFNNIVLIISIEYLFVHKTYNYRKYDEAIDNILLC